MKARYYVHGHYAKVKVTILNSSIDESAGAVRVHWRLTGLPQMKVFFMFWKFAPFRFKETAEKQSELAYSHSVLLLIPMWLRLSADFEENLLGFLVIWFTRT